MESKYINLYIFLKSRYKQYLDDNNIKICNKCGGHGLGNVKKFFHNDFSWDGKSFCETCKGVGFTDIPKKIVVDDSHFLCNNCYGGGCKDCNNGIVDWITAILQG